jgi:predicted nucleic acid-binding protein
MPAVDIILDANIILADPAFGSPQFVEMLAYLRRTGSRLVVPTIVVEEVLERYRERLLGHINAARSKWTELRKTAMSEMEDFPAVDLEKNVSLVRQKLEKPSAGVESLIYSDVSTIDVAEVARRGIKRKRPASAKGEELRDVILWFVVLQYARQTKRAVAFMSDDSGFRVSKEAAELHPDLRTEIDNEGLSLKFYREIASFVREHALKQQPISQEWVSKHVSTEKLAEEICQRLRELVTWANVVKAEIVALDFAEGVEYTISQSSTYVEAKYLGAAVINISAVQPRR